MKKIHLHKSYIKYLRRYMFQLRQKLQSKLSQLQKILSINYDFKDLISKQIISQFQFFRVSKIQ
jgi:hypothetical protein